MINQDQTCNRTQKSNQSQSMSQTKVKSRLVTQKNKTVLLLIQSRFQSQDSNFFSTVATKHRMTSYKTKCSTFHFYTKPVSTQKSQISKWEVRSNPKPNKITTTPHKNKKAKKKTKLGSTSWKWGLGFWVMLTWYWVAEEEERDSKSPQKQRKTQTLMWVQICRNSSYLWSSCVSVRVCSGFYIHVCLSVKLLIRSRGSQI